MLERIEIEGFRALARVDLPLKPLTVLIGQNDSGKSSFLGAVRLLATEANPDKFDYRDGDLAKPIILSARTASGHVISKRNNAYHDKSGLSYITPHESYVLPSTGVPMSSSGVESGILPTPQESGQLVAAILDSFLRSDRKRFDQIESVIRQHLPGIDALAIETPQTHTRRVDLVFQSGMQMPADRASTGARLMIFFITLAYHPSPPKLILLEEPENGVHPQRLKQIVALLREIAEGKHGKHAAQIIMTTHSPYLLDSIDPSRDQVIVFRRDDAGQRIAAAIDTNRLKGFLDEFMLGEVWYNQGEEGLVKKTG